MMKPDDKHIFYPDDFMSDGAALQMAAEMSGMEYDEYIFELAARLEADSEEGASDE